MKLLPEVVERIIEAVALLDKNYGTNRNIETVLGGYIGIAENIVDIETLKQDKLQGLIPEYTDVIECSGGVNWTSSLFLLSSDYTSMIVITTEKLFKYLIE